MKSLSDDELLRRLAETLSQSRRIESELVAHIAEVDARRLFAREAMPSMFRYATDVLRLSEAEAYLRIAVARASRQFPVLLEMLADGRLHLSGIAELTPHLTVENCDELLARATHESKREIQKLVAEIRPQPDVPDVMRKLPAKKAKAELGPDRVPSSEPTMEAESSTEKRQERPQEKPAVVAPLSPKRYKIQFTASEELHDKLERLAALMPGADLATIIDAAVTEKLERLEAKRYGKSKAPRKNVEDADTSAGSRAIPAPVRRVVSERDGFRCTFVSSDGKRCEARDRLEFHHDDPCAKGGDRSPRNIRLLCRAHNAYLAELEYGKEKIDRYRRGADRAREPAPTLELRPDGAQSLLKTVRASNSLDAAPWTVSRSARGRLRLMRLDKLIGCTPGPH